MFESHHPDMLELGRFKKSRHSGGTCVEVGVFHKSTRSDADCVEVALAGEEAMLGEEFKTSTYTQLMNCVEVAFKKSSYTVLDCVEVGGSETGGNIVVRDSKDKAGPTLTFTPAEWRAFIAGVKDGEFDLPV